MQDVPIHFKSLVEIGDLVRRRVLSSVQVTQTLLQRIETLDSHFMSYVHVCADRALSQAQAADADLDRGIWRGPLHGVPLAVKDLCQTTFAPTTAGTTIHADFIAPHSATVVDRLETAGAVMLGKLTMTEGAYTSHHPKIPAPLNPWSAAHWVGSSSTGSGVATAAGLTYGAIGSDTGGSIRFPSATCGLTGIKPTWGRVSRHGVFALADSLDHVGPMARSAADCAAMLQAIAGWDAQDATSIDAPVPDYLAETGRGIRDLRIGIDRSYALSGIDAQVAGAVEQAVAALEALGARIVDVTFPDYQDLVASWISMCAVETAIAHEATYPARAAEYGPDLVQLIEEGRRTTGLQATRGLHLRLKFTEALATMFRRIDCMIVPTMPVPLPSLVKMGEYGEDPGVLNSILRFTAPFDFAGNPTITLPNGIDQAGMPLSMQLVGPRLGEAVLVRAGHAYQTVTDWHCRHPAIG
ncbi:MAG: amidase [Rhodobacteraceae bacterium]|nr:amidase [Paracoccaceae bacterium]